MNTATTWQTRSLEPAATSAIGVLLGRNCIGGELFLFRSDLGGGKTTMVKGLAAGLGSTDATGSPSFALSKVYKCRDGIELHHFDFYRLAEAGLMVHELSEVLEDPMAVVAIEWGDIAQDVLPAQRIEIHIDKTADNEEARIIAVTYPKQMGYIAEGLA